MSVVIVVAGSIGRVINRIRIILWAITIVIAALVFAGIIMAFRILTHLYTDQRSKILNNIRFKIFLKKS